VLLSCACAIRYTIVKKRIDFKFICKKHLQFLLTQKKILIKTTLYHMSVFVGSWQAPVPDCLDIGALFRQTGRWRDDDNYGLELFLGIQGALAAGGTRKKYRTFCIF